MEESKRQKQVARLIQEELSVIFQKEGLNIIDGGMLSIAYVQVTPDLLEARVYLSLFQIKDHDALMQTIKDKTAEIRHQIGNSLRHHLRRIPSFQFFKDDTMEHVFKLEEIFKKIKEDQKGDSTTN